MNNIEINSPNRKIRLHFSKNNAIIAPYVMTRS